VEAASTSLSRRKWLSFVLLVLLSLGLPELMLGPFALVGGILAASFGTERAIRSWREGNRLLSLGVLALCGALLVYLLTAQWCHAGNAHLVDSLWRGVTHCHRVWDFDHIH